MGWYGLDERAKDVDADLHENSYVKEYRLLIIGGLILLLGCVMVIHAINWEAFGLWFPITMVLFGLLITGAGGAATLIGILMLGSGCSILLHQMGIVTFPYLKEILGWLFIVLGTFGVTKGSLGVWKKYKRLEAKAKAKQ